MVQLAFSFLLGIHDEKEKQNIWENREKENGEEEKEIEEIEVSKVEFCCHVDYSLERGKSPKSIDVVSWEKAAKIYFQDSTSAIEPFYTQNLKWIYFGVKHTLNLGFDDVTLFRTHNLKFIISLESAKLGDAAKADKPTKFYGLKRARSDGKPIFRELKESTERWETDLSSSIESVHRLYLSSLMQNSSHYKKLASALLRLSEEYRDGNENRKPSYLSEETPALVDLLQDQLYSKDKILGKKEKSKSQKRAEHQNGNKIEFSISGEQLFSGQKLLERTVKYNSEKVPFVVFLCEVNSLMSPDRARFFKPLCITINNLDAVPVEYFKTKGIHHLKLRFLICNRFLSETNPIPVEERMPVNHTRCIFTKDIKEKNLIEFLQTEGLTFELIGILNKTQSEIPQSEGIALPTKSENKNFDEQEENLIFIGEIFADVSFLLLQPHRIRVTSFIRTGQKRNWRTESRYTMACSRRKDGEVGLAGSGGVFESLTMTATVGLAHPLSSGYRRAVAEAGSLKRLVAVFENAESALPVLRIINGGRGREAVGAVGRGHKVQRPLSKYHGAGRGGKAREARVTGFSVDCVEFVIVYAEGCESSDLGLVWAQASRSSPKNARLLYDSSLIFSSRVYDKFEHLGGFLATALREPLSGILRKCVGHSSAKIPEPAKMALTKINLLRKCSSIKSATQNHLFPDSDSLLGLALEFGSPVHCFPKSDINPHSQLPYHTFK